MLKQLLSLPPWYWDLLISVMYITAIFGVANIERLNGRVEMCKEIGKIYIEGDGCINIDEYNSLYNKSIEPVINISNLGGSKLNATIL